MAWTGNVFDGNVLYNSNGGSIFMGSGKNYITNNVSLQKAAGMGPYVSMQGFTFANNYSEGSLSIQFRLPRKPRESTRGLLKSSRSPATYSTTRADASTTAETLWMPGRATSTATCTSEISIGLWD